MFDPTQCESVSMAQAKAQEEQNPVSAALRATSIAFVALAESGQIDDTTATENVSQFASWAYPVAYAVGNIRQYNGELFRCVQAHTSQTDWTPDATASLWKKVGDPTEEWPDWSQPVGAHDAYNSGDKVSHNGARRSLTAATPYFSAVSVLNGSWYDAAVPARDCHVGLRPPCNDKSGSCTPQDHIFV